MNTRNQVYEVVACWFLIHLVGFFALSRLFHMGRPDRAQATLSTDAFTSAGYAVLMIGFTIARLKRLNKL